MTDLSVTQRRTLLLLAAIAGQARNAAQVLAELKDPGVDAHGMGMVLKGLYKRHLVLRYRPAGRRTASYEISEAGIAVARLL